MKTKKSKQVQLREAIKQDYKTLDTMYKKNKEKLLSLIQNSFEEWSFVYEHSTGELEKLALQKMREYMKK